MRYVELSGVGNDSNDKPPIAKRSKLDDQDEDSCDRYEYTRQIHILADVLDVLEIGGREPQMST